uniref:Uncharacterized protein n=1 Tax=Pyxicephalus adspersus TaxID=30357 RepID=A0AAV3B8V2_PYXAD|nr:TPA: hypothetical protein GDO54_007581 [Pyxicephalus adspersus]
MACYTHQIEQNIHLPKQYTSYYSIKGKVYIFKHWHSKCIRHFVVTHQVTDITTNRAAMTISVSKDKMCICLPHIKCVLSAYQRNILCMC